MPRKKENKTEQNITKDEVKKDIKTDSKTDVETVDEVVISEEARKKLFDELITSFKDYFNREFREKLKDDITHDLSDDIKKSIRKDQDKVYRQKNFKIFRLYIYIILLIAACFFLIYRLYDTGNLPIFNDYEIVKKEEIPTKPTSSPTTTEKVKDLNWYKEQYGYLLDNVVITNYELLKGNYEFKDVDITDRLAMAAKLLKASDITSEGIIHTIAEDKIKACYEQVFGSLDTYSAVTFKLDNLNYAYSSSTTSYIAVGNTEKNDEQIIYDISNIKVDNEDVMITVYVALKKDRKIYNIYNVSESLGNDSDNLNSYKEKLSQVTYQFKAISDDTYYLYAVTKK